MPESFITFDALEVQRCRLNCQKTCCITCGNFLSASREESSPNILFDVHCLVRINDEFDMNAGANNCVFFITA